MNQDMEPKEQDEPVESLEDGRLRRSTGAEDLQLATNLQTVDSLTLDVRLKKGVM